MGLHHVIQTAEEALRRK